uniref:Uncharacterized protein n=1 Tax=Haptolina brevifila TaxID=156173 RepID=A0A7S2ISK7_9EUKA|mmetsp:Transcript_70434/g.139613  ORF Transcript_70434/g.139613 Transcript_70434/m.139613 type:complete len:361 (+) Transcript_70434:96-1178(+)
MATRTAWSGDSGYLFATPVSLTAASPQATRKKRAVELQPGSASMASYRKAKEYLISQGHSDMAVMNAPSTFHLRSYALSKGIDLVKVKALEESATEAALSAKLAEQHAIEMQNAAKEAAREAESASLAAQAATERVESVRDSTMESSVTRFEADDVHEVSMQNTPITAVELESEEHKTRLTLTQQQLEAAEHENLAQAEREAALESQRKAEALEKAKEAEREATLEHARAAQALAEAQEKVIRERAALGIQAATRGFLQQRVYYKAWKAVVTLQSLWRGSIIQAVYRQLTSHVAVLRAGGVFTTVSQSGKKERFFCLSPDYSLLLWCAPSRQEKALRGQLTQPNEMPEISQLPVKNVRTC